MLVIDALSAILMLCLVLVLIAPVARKFSRFIRFLFGEEE